MSHMAAQFYITNGIASMNKNVLNLEFWWNVSFIHPNPKFAVMKNQIKNGRKRNGDYSPNLKVGVGGCVLMLRTWSILIKYNI